ncbi:N-acetylglucosamine kinase [Umezawaea tangerina]|uniref:N-acetylglucosamine kinase-like BadF-type ATPase n=1 Tax=Umezawaea tangerina TaxID=84725 RepID=A0A2T0TGS6_9PSEU|nr:BadF/BadG/BcrA/BcrD ATPase family protein [Umezawaea tangerina]PRY44894.1 N-acetylglucosamine kinase-like BadF-type ATPase [Umezawaea tangerina]
MGSTSEPTSPGTDAKVFLGVDGGGTKTAFALLTDDGTLLASGLAASCYYLGQSIDLVEQVLRNGIDTVCGQAGIAPDRITHAFFALPGYGEVSADVETLDGIPERVLGHRRYGCDNDMVAGWAGSLGAVDGVNVIAGTGSMTYGEHDGRGLRVGGWGELFDDEGSAYWIAIRGLAAFAKMSDGRLPVGPLRGKLSVHLGLAADLDLVDVVLNRWQGDRARIAALARVVTEAAADGDEVCAGILRDAGKALAGLVKATTAQLGYAAGDVVPVSWSGGVFASAEVRASFRDHLADAGVDLRDPLLPPVLGAALHAARLAGSPLSAEIVDSLQAHATTVALGGSDE